jgi:hypothetical protein
MASANAVGVDVKTKSGRALPLPSNSVRPDNDPMLGTTPQDVVAVKEPLSAVPARLRTSAGGKTLTSPSPAARVRLMVTDACVQSPRHKRCRTYLLWRHELTDSGWMQFITDRGWSRNVFDVDDHMTRIDAFEEFLQFTTKAPDSTKVGFRISGRGFVVEKPETMHFQKDCFCVNCNLAKTSHLHAATFAAFDRDVDGTGTGSTSTPVDVSPVTAGRQGRDHWRNANSPPEPPGQLSPPSPSPDSPLRPDGPSSSPSSSSSSPAASPSSSTVSISPLGLPRQLQPSSRSTTSCTRLFSMV